jgi:O-antigen ligase
MTRVAAALDRRLLPQWPVIAALGACLLTATALVVVGPIVALGFVALLGILLLVRRPGIALAVLLASTILLEADPYGFLPATTRFYEGAPSLSELVMATATVAVLLDLGLRHRPPVLPEPFTVPLALLGLAFVAGTVSGRFLDGRVSEALWLARPVGYMMLVSLLVVNLLGDRRRVLLFAAGAGVLAVVKGLAGTAAWALGVGRPLEEVGALGGTVLTYYEPTANFVMLLFVLAAVGAVLMRVPLPLWIKVSSPFVLAAFVLSFRRSFWIAAVLGIVLVMMLTSGIRGRRLVFPTFLVLAGAIWVAIAAGSATYAQGPLVERAQTLAPTRLDARDQDLYRLQEAKNVLSELRHHPITGLGVGVPWSAVDHALPEEHPGGRHYTHVVVLHYWLKFGLLGVAAYLSLIGVAIFSAVRIWRFGADPWLQVAGLATATALVGVMVAETTASFTGVDYRFSIVMGGLIGWLSAAGAHGLRTRPPEPDRAVR